MPSSATDILSVADAKVALRIDDGPGVDDEVERCIAAAVDFCQAHAAKPLLDRDVTELVERPALSARPLRLPSIYVKSVTAIRYWETDQKLRDEPDGTVLIAYADPADPQDDEDPIGRLEAPVDRHYTAIWPPAAGWPETLTDSKFRVTYVEGWPDAAGDPSAQGYDVAADVPGIDGIRKAVALMSGTYYDGLSDEAHRDAVRSLLQPFADARWQV